MGAYEFQQSTGIDPGRKPESEIGIYPNPAKGKVNMVLDNTQNTEISLVIYDLTGNLVQSLHQGFLKAGSYKFSSRHLKPGSYLLKLSNSNEVRTSKILVF